jgi:hypothetical protein
MRNIEARRRHFEAMVERKAREDRKAAKAAAKAAKGVSPPQKNVAG